MNRSGSIVHRVQTNSKGGETVKALRSPGEVVGGDQAVEMPNELIVGCIVVSLEGRVLDRPVHPLELPLIRYVARTEGALRRSRGPCEGSNRRQEPRKS